MPSLNKVLEKKIVEHSQKGCSNISAEINLERSLIVICERSKKSEYVISSGKENTPTSRGTFLVAEKWVDPYWKTTNGKIYLPGEKNPLGKYLIILADYKTGQKTHCAVHEWFRFNGLFKKGKQTQGCITLPKETIEKVFYKLPLGAKVTIT